MTHYLKEYKWSNIFALVRNSKLDPKHCPNDFKGRLVVITGATSGIGFATAEKFASRGADLILVNRNETRSIEVCDHLRSRYHVNCEYLLADFSRLLDVHAAGKKLAGLDRDIDVLIHNAGNYLVEKTITADRLEAVFQTNYLSTFILNYTLREKLLHQKSGRILFINSEAHRFAVLGMDMQDLNWERHSYSGAKSYGTAKLAQLLSMLKFADYFSGSGITINAMHPGNVKTNSGQSNNAFYRFFKKLFVDSSARPIEISTEAIYYLCVSEDVEKVSGKFFNLTTEEIPAPPALDRVQAEKLWETSLLIGGFNGN